MIEKLISYQFRDEIHTIFTEVGSAYRIGSGEDCAIRIGGEDDPARILTFIRNRDGTVNLYDSEVSFLGEVAFPFEVEVLGSNLLLFAPSNLFDESLASPSLHGESRLEIVWPDGNKNVLAAEQLLCAGSAGDADIPLPSGPLYAYAFHWTGGEQIHVGNLDSDTGGQWLSEGVWSGNELVNLPVAIRAGDEVCELRIAGSVAGENIASISESSTSELATPAAMPVSNQAPIEAHDSFAGKTSESTASMDLYSEPPSSPEFPPSSASPQHYSVMTHPQQMVYGVPVGLHSQATAFLLTFLLGPFGADRFYLGQVGLGLLKLFTCGGFGIWATVDAYIIGMGAATDDQGWRLRRDIIGTPQKSQSTTFLLSSFLGTLGVDHFYLGNTGFGILKLLTLGGLGVWSLIDVLLTGLGVRRDAQGNSLY